MSGTSRSGRKPKPTAQKVLQGTFRPDRHRGEVLVPHVWPEPPSFLTLTTQQRALWDGLKQHDCWHAATDWPAVLGLVVTLDELIQNQAAQRETETSGHPLAFKHMVKHTAGADGKPVEVEYVMTEGNPLKAEGRKFLDHLYKFAAINGYSPVDRAKMPASLDTIDPANPLDRFVKKPK